MRLVEPRLVIADAPRAKRIQGVCGSSEILSLDVAQPLETALAPILAGASEGAALPEVEPEDDATILFTSGSTGVAKGALSTHRAVTTATYTYASGLMILLGILTDEAAAAIPRTFSACPWFHVTGEVPVTQQLRRWPLPCGDGQVGRNRSATADRERGDHLFRRRADHELELLNLPTPQMMIVDLRDITAGGAPRPVQPRRTLAAGVSRCHSRRRLRPDRDQRRRLHQHVGQLMPPSPRPTGRARAAVRRCRIFWVPTTPICPL